MSRYTLVPPLSVSDYICSDTESYNEAVTFSSGKGLAHTLARRAGFLLQTGEHMLALRDLHLGGTTNRRKRYFKGELYIQLLNTAVLRMSYWTG